MWQVCYWNNIQYKDVCNGIQDLETGSQCYCPPVFDKGVKDVIGMWQLLQQIILEKRAYPAE